MKPRNPTLIIGLGNPGSRYANTYHNVGASATQYLIEHDVSDHQKTRKAPLFEYTRGAHLIYVVPRVYMNDSGRAVRAALGLFRKTPEDLLVIHDESDLPLGSSRLVFGRGGAGHRGVVSIIQTLGTKAFWRFRIGVRTKPGKAEEFVLRAIPKRERDIFYGVFEELRRNVNEKESP